MWGLQLCHGCNGLWSHDARFEAKAIYAACGLRWEANAGEGDLDLLCAELSRRTRAWAAEGRASGRAA